MNGPDAPGNADGCWTCRVRRKKCDKKWPVCQVCSALLITCHYEREKPDWLDGGTKQQEMVEQLKQEVKDRIPQRRSLAYAKAFIQESPNTAPSSELPMAHPNLSDRGYADDSHHRCNGILPRRLETSEAAFPTSSYGPVSSEMQVQQPANRGELDRGLLVCYLDFFFPFLFPFYHPSVLDRGRAWIMDFITDSTAMEQTTLSLSSYFFALAIETTEEPGHQYCKQKAWKKVLQQTHSTFGILQEELRSFANEVVPEQLPRIVRIMGCILLLQRFETAIWSFENSEAHLNGAIELFKQALKTSNVAAADPYTEQSRFELISDLLRSYESPWPDHLQRLRSPSPEYMAFHFFSGLLIVDDVISSTALGQEPKLLQYHNSILGDGRWASNEQYKPQISLESIMGCQNWALVAVAKISTLVAWKKRQREACDLDMMELVIRATAIKNALIADMARLDSDSTHYSATANNPWDVFNPCNARGSMLADQSVVVTRLWAHAAAIYLAVVVSGWQSASFEIRHHVSCVAELFSKRQLSWATLRTVAWPFCVAGCLAQPAQEHCFRGVIEGLQPRTLLGPLQKALEIMENVWRQRESLNDSWDLEACFRRPNYTVLLL